MPLVDLAIEAVEPLSRRERFTRLDDLVFPAPDGDFFTPDPLRKSLYMALTAAGYGHLRDKRPGRLPFRWHDLRHCFETLAAQAFSLRDVQAFMGHEHISTTEIYLHHIPQADAAKKLNAVLAPKIGASAVMVATSESAGAQGVHVRVS
ncbi:MAG: site-specific integrase [Actinomycetota bacterium]|nr:site-specific integrase [Actinomycetota bacterium]